VRAVSSRLAITPVIVLIASVSVEAGAPVPPGVFTLNHTTIGVTTLDEVRKTYGMVEPSRVGPEEEADIAICYVHPSSKGKVSVVFESGAMGGWKEITGFRLSAQRGGGHCVSTEMNISTLATENGIRLGQSLEGFTKAMPIKFRHRGSALTYEGVSQRAATQEELKRLRAEWPDERQDYFDVTITIRATFSANRLVDFYVRKNESY
jgi:hypothetical protein